MEDYLVVLGFAISTYFFLYLFFQWWISPWLLYRKLRANGFFGPNPNFPLGNLNQIKNQKPDCSNISSSDDLTAISNDIHSFAFPYFATWQQSHGKVWVFWIGTAPFLYIAEPEFLKKMSSDIRGKNWGKADVFRQDRMAIFGKSVVTSEGEEWVRRRHFITGAFSPHHLKATATLMMEATASMVLRWSAQICSGEQEIDVEKEIIFTVAEVAAKTSCGMSCEDGRQVLEKLRALQRVLFYGIGHVGVPFGKFLSPKRTMSANKLGKKIDDILYSAIKRSWVDGSKKDLVGTLMAPGGGAKQPLAPEEMVDECKTFFFGMYETTGLVLTWSLLLLAVHPEWQRQLREEVGEVVGFGEIKDVSELYGLKKMGWVMNEVLRLYGPVPTVQRQAKHDIKVGNLVIPNGTNIWIDVVSMHHDPNLWGEDVYEFKPERFENDIHGGCAHKMGFLPFGFGGRMCVGKNLANLEYRVVLTLILSKFSFTVSSSYCHSPTIILSLRPPDGIPLVFRHL
ncbi:cytokinin hydroxylase-like [Andrographis paniculata]|uniref:cytokinin hydroxylase-like n=1 Tax=Andrographis paniculata TaxID=175694 RepID=UPI0021E70CFF|nr:cytokinin hydroxylase-like [Andrographis paniculata]